MGLLTEGRIVHYVSYDKKHLAAIVIGFDREKECEKPVRVDLAIFSSSKKPAWVMRADTADFIADKVGGHQNLIVNVARLVRSDALQFQPKIPFNSDKTPGTWHWMEAYDRSKVKSQR